MGNKKVNVAKLLDGHNGIELYHKIYGSVKLELINHCYRSDFKRCYILVKTTNGNFYITDKYGMSLYENEMVLFPSKEEKNWDNFVPNKQ